MNNPVSLRSIPFRVELWPRAEAVELCAADTIEAAELARARRGISNEAMVWRVGVDPQLGPPAPGGCGIIFDDRPCCVHFVAFRDEFGREYESARRLWGSPNFFHRKWDQRAQREIAPYDVIVFARGSEHEEPSWRNVDDSSESGDPADEERKVLNRGRSKQGAKALSVAHGMAALHLVRR